MALAGLYRRVLPSPPAIEFASPQGKQLFAEAQGGGTMEGFFKLIPSYQTQSEVTYCGPATLAMVLNALAIDPGRIWKAPWRWFDDTMLDCCEPLIKIKAEGITFGKLAYLAYCNGANVEAFRTNESSIHEFRKHVISSTSSEDCHIIISYQRTVFRQAGDGHYSVIGGYHAGNDVVLLLEVARFKYPPHWVPLALLWEAMDTIDKSTGRTRGVVLRCILRSSTMCLFMFQIHDYLKSCRNEAWNKVAKYLTEDVPFRLNMNDVKRVENLLSVVFTSATVDLEEFIKWVEEVGRQEDLVVILNEQEKGSLDTKEEVLKQIQETELFKHVNKWLASEISTYVGLASLGCQQSLPEETSSNVCCQGAEHLSRTLGSSADRTCLGETNVIILRVDNEKHMTVVSGTINGKGIEQGIDTLVPPSQKELSNFGGLGQSKLCNPLLPCTGHILTVLPLALPQQTWSCIKEEKLLTRFSHLVSIANLPSRLQQEVLHLRQLLHFIMIDQPEPSISG